MLAALAWIAALCAAIPFLLTVLNLWEYQPPAPATGPLPPVTVIIPARNEEAGIAACVTSVLASEGVSLDVVVVDDASTDRTASIVEELTLHHPRLHLHRAAPLPEGWNGKQHACWQAAETAATPLLCFLDADVRLEPECIARCASVLVHDRAALISGFPREVTGTWLETLLIPLVHFILLGLLPMRFLRTTTIAGFAAGCGQFLLLDHEAYLRSGGHAAIRHTMHDGLLLPRLLRTHGFSTRLVDLTALASCRMYSSAQATWNGLAKNATEGLAAPVRIVPVTFLLGFGQVLPLPLLWLAWRHTIFIIPFLGPPIRTGMGPVWLCAAAVFMSWLPRIVNAARYRQSRVSVLLHPFGMATLLALQWYALTRKLLRLPATWKARTYTSG